MNGEAGGEYPDGFAELPVVTERGKIFQGRSKLNAGVRVEMHFRAQAGADFQQVHLIQLHAHFHLGGIHNGHEGQARTHLVSLLDSAHAAAEPDGVVDHHARHGRVHGHFGGVALRVAHGLHRAVPLNLENVDPGRCGGSFQLVSLFQLLQCGLCFLRGLLILFGVDAGDDFIALEFELCALQLVLGLLQTCVVLGAGDIFLGLLLSDLAYQVVVRGFLIEIVLGLGLRVEFHEDVALLYGRPGSGQFGDDHGTHLRPLEPGSQDRKGVGGHGGSIQAERLREVLFLDSINRLRAARRGLRPAEMEEKKGHENECQQSEGA